MGLFDKIKSNLDKVKDIELIHSKQYNYDRFLKLDNKENCFEIRTIIETKHEEYLEEDDSRIKYIWAQFNSYERDDAIINARVYQKLYPDNFELQMELNYFSGIYYSWLAKGDNEDLDTLNAAKFCLVQAKISGKMVEEDLTEINGRIEEALKTKEEEYNELLKLDPEGNLDEKHRVFKILKNYPDFMEKENAITQYLLAEYDNGGNDVFDITKEYLLKYPKMIVWNNIIGRYLRSRARNKYENISKLEDAITYYRLAENIDKVEEIEKQIIEIKQSKEEEKQRLIMEFPTLNAIEYYEKIISIYTSIYSDSTNDIEIVDKYIIALQFNAQNNNSYLNSIGKILNFCKEYPNQNHWNSIIGNLYISWANHKMDVDLINKAIEYYKLDNNKDAIIESKSDLKLLKQAIKDDAKEKNQLEKQAKKERLAKEKQAEKELLAKEKQAEKEKEAADKLKKHDFKTSRGEQFCKYCGKSTIYVDSPCLGHINNHNYAHMKNSGGDWEIRCKKCGGRDHWADSSCEGNRF